jgi:hypothetical protein
MSAQAPVRVECAGSIWQEIDRGGVGADGFGGAARQERQKACLGQALGNERCGACQRT